MIITSLHKKTYKYPEWSPVVVASDASELASGVVFHDADVSTVSNVATVVTTPGLPSPPVLQSFVETTKWKVAISHRWYDQEHINALEMRSALAAVRWSLTRPAVLQPYPSGSGHSKLLLLCDSSAAVGSINKGRSSAHRLLRPLRSMASLVLAAGVYVVVKWLPSALNPADAPSRLLQQ
jgi:hypothetical protein